MIPTNIGVLLPIIGLILTVVGLWTSISNSKIAKELGETLRNVDKVVTRLESNVQRLETGVLAQVLEQHNFMVKKLLKMYAYEDSTGSSATKVTNKSDQMDNS